MAGNIVTPTQLGSVEFAAEKFGVPLVLVLGHSRCGAVEVTLAALRQSAASQSPNLDALVECIRPSVEPILESGAVLDTEQLIAQSVRANIRGSVDRLRRGSKILERLIEGDKLRVLGAEFCLDTGLVDLLDFEN